MWRILEYIVHVNVNLYYICAQWYAFEIHNLKFSVSGLQCSTLCALRFTYLVKPEQCVGFPLLLHYTTLGIHMQTNVNMWVGTRNVLFVDHFQFKTNDNMETSPVLSSLASKPANPLTTTPTCYSCFFKNLVTLIMDAAHSFVLYQVRGYACTQHVISTWDLKVFRQIWKHFPS